MNASFGLTPVGIVFHPRPSSSLRDIRDHPPRFLWIDFRHGHRHPTRGSLPLLATARRESWRSGECRRNARRIDTKCAMDIWLTGKEYRYGGDVRRQLTWRPCGLEEQPRRPGAVKRWKGVNRYI